MVMMMVDKGTGAIKESPDILPTLYQSPGLLQRSILERLANSPSLHGQSFRVLVYLLAVAEPDNSVPGTGSLAETIGINQKSVCRAYSELAQAGFILKRQGDYYLSPWVFWRGTEWARQDFFDALVKDMSCSQRLWESHRPEWIKTYRLTPGPRVS